MPSEEGGEREQKSNKTSTASLAGGFEWSRAMPWIGMAVTIFSAGVSAALLLSAKADRAEVIELGKKVDELKTTNSGLDKSICLSNQRVDYVNSRLIVIEEVFKGWKGETMMIQTGPSKPTLKTFLRRPR
jgi:hypothetical protein